MKNVSSLNEHVFEKKGIVATPLNHAFRSTLRLNSWSHDRLPEYLWMGLIFRRHERRDGLEILGRILKEVANLNLGLSLPRISSILKLSVDEQCRIYDIVIEHAGSLALAPLTLIIGGENRCFYERFLDPAMTVRERLDIIREALSEYYDHQSNAATDLRFLATSFLSFSGRLHFSSEVKGAIEAFAEYAYTEHSDEKMRSYRPRIRAAEVFDFEDEDCSFSRNFWKEVGMIDECKPFYVGHKNGTASYESLLPDTRKVLDYKMASDKQALLDNDKFSVFVGSISYVLKILEEIKVGNLDNAILGRHGVRTISEVFIVLKYLLKHEAENANIWSEYKHYGVSKLKLILLKAREKTREEYFHFVEPIIDTYVNEKVWEEFVDIDLKYFDKQNVRAKSDEVGEKGLYDIMYDYDSGFVHGLWGAVRESSMLVCNNPTHEFHNIPDIHNEQKLPSVINDAENIVLRIIHLLNENYPLPDWYAEKYQKGLV